jgi:hypothetical protein
MNCPPEIAATLVEILQNALLHIRARGWERDPVVCAREAEHVHNLPGLLTNYAPERLRYYWEVERPAFVAQSNPDSLALFAPLWQRLEALLPGTKAGCGQR